MTYDMNELREKLTERGIKYRTTEVHGMPVTLYESGGRTWSVTDHPDGYLVVNCVSHTPKQAIAATLGDEWDGRPFVEYAEHVAKEMYEEAFALLECCDEPDFSAIDAICGACSDLMGIARKWRMGESQDGRKPLVPFETAGSLTAEQVREAIENNGTASLGCRWQFTDRNLQAIADELNAELGNGTCERATDSEGVRIDVADTVHMLRSEYDGDHEWDDVVIELAYCKHGGDRWIVRGARGEAWACDCTVTGHDEELYDKSDDWENLPTPWDAPEPDGWHKCPECGCTVGYTELYGGGWSIMMDDYQIPYNNCPKCGRPILMCDVEAER